VSSLYVNQYNIHRFPDKTSHFYFYDNFGTFGPILTVLSRLHLVINCGRGRSKRCHLTSYLLPHYLVKFECSTVPFTAVVPHKSNGKSLFTVSIYTTANFLFTCLFPKCPPSAHARAASDARHWLMDGVNDVLFNAAPGVQ